MTRCTVCQASLSMEFSRPEYCKVKVKVAQLWPILCDPMDCSQLGSSVHGILQARIPEWVAIPFSRGSSRPRDWTLVSSIAGRFFIIWATREAPEWPKSLGLSNVSKSVIFELKKVSWPCCVACGILVPWPGIKPVLPAVEARSLNCQGSPSRCLIFGFHCLWGGWLLSENLSSCGWHWVPAQSSHPKCIGCTIFVPEVSTDASLPLMGSHTDILQPALVARDGVRLEVHAPLEQSGAASPGGMEDEMRAFSQSRTRIRLSRKGNGCWCQNNRCLSQASSVQT